MDEYLKNLKGEGISPELRPILAFFEGETLSIRYYSETGWFVVSGRRWDGLLKRKDFIALFRAVLSEYVPDEIIDLVNEAHKERLERPRPIVQLKKENIPQSGFVYLLFGGGYYKIGATTDIDRRVDQISPRLPFEVTLIHTIKTSDIAWLEQRLHDTFTNKRTNGEWFKLDAQDTQWLQEIDEWNPD